MSPHAQSNDLTSFAGLSRKVMPAIPLSLSKAKPKSKPQNESPTDGLLGTPRNAKENGEHARSDTRSSAGIVAFGGPQSHTSSPAPPLSAGPASESLTRGQYPPYIENMHFNFGPGGGYEEGFPMPLSGSVLPPPVRVSLPSIPLPSAIRAMADPFVSRPVSAKQSGSFDGHNQGSATQSPLIDSGSEYGKADTYYGHDTSRYSHFSQPMWSPAQHAYMVTPAGFEDLEALRDHLQALFLHPQISDCQILMKEGGDGTVESFTGHSAILSRSTTLLSLIQTVRQQSPDVMTIQVHIDLAEPYFSIGAMRDALKYLYARPALSLDPLGADFTSKSGYVGKQARMEEALQRVAVGAWLKLPTFASRNLDIASNLLHWETMSLAIGFATQGGINQIWKIEDGSEEKSSSSSSEHSSNKPEEYTSPIYDPYSTTLLQRIIDFLVHVFPTNFYLDSTAPELSACQRLPPYSLERAPRTVRSDPRLSQLRFGDIPAEDLQRPSATTTTLSSVLLSLPFALLKCVLEHYDLTTILGSDTVASVMRQVVAERESRRAKALRARLPTPPDDDVDPQLVQNLHWEERVKQSLQHRAGFLLSRRRCGIETPASSGAGSEQTD